MEENIKPHKEHVIPPEAKLQSEIAALKYKNERLSQELRECESKLRAKEQSLMQQNNELETHKENLARINSINNSFQKQLQDLETREKNAASSNLKLEGEIQKLKYESQHYQDRVVDLESQLRSTMIDRDAFEQGKESAEKAMNDFCRKVASAIDFHEDEDKPELTLKKIHEIYQENARLKVSVGGLKQSVHSYENESKATTDLINRLNNEKDNLNQQIVSHLTNLDVLRREKDQLISEKNRLQNDLQAYKDTSASSSRTISALNEKIRGLEHQISSSKENILIAEDRALRAEKELKNFQDSVAIQLSSGSRVVDATSISIRERIKDLHIDLREKCFDGDQLREKIGRLQEAVERLERSLSESRIREGEALSDKTNIVKRLEEVEAQLTTCEILNEGLRKDKSRFMERTGSIMGLDEVSKELGFDLQTDALIVRAEQLAKLENDKLADKTATVYQLQRRLRTLKEQLEKKELHLEMLRKKIVTLEESVKLRSTLELERDEAYSRVKKLTKQVERVDTELRDCKLRVKELKSQLADAAEYKIIALERARKIEDSERRINDLELLRCKYNRKLNFLKDQLKSNRQNCTQERELHDSAFQQLSQDLNSTRKSLLESQRRESQLLNLRNTIGRILGIDWSQTIVPDYEIMSKLEKIVQTNKEFAQVSKKLTENIKTLPGSGRTGAADSSPRDSEDTVNPDALLELDGNKRRFI